MKKTIAILAAVMLAASTLTTSAYAADFDFPVGEEIIEEYAIFDSLQSSLSMFGNTASLTSMGFAADAQTISVSQSLEKQTGWFWNWETVHATKWNKTENGNTVILCNQRYGLTSGKYRLKSVFSVTSTTGQTETVTVYSSEETIS